MANQVYKRPATPVDAIIGTRIKLRRESMKITQWALGKHVGVTYQQIQKYESGQSRVACSTIVDIANALSVSAGFFFSDPDIPLAKIHKSEVNALTREELKLLSYAARMTPKQQSALITLIKAMTGKAS